MSRDLGLLILEYKTVPLAVTLEQIFVVNCMQVMKLRGQLWTERKRDEFNCDRTRPRLRSMTQIEPTVSMDRPTRLPPWWPLLPTVTYRDVQPVERIMQLR